MTVEISMQKVLKQYRILLTSLRTPKLRERFKELLHTQDVSRETSPVTDAGLDKPFSQIDWLDSSYDSSMNELGSQIDRINELLSPNSILYTQPIDDLPMNWKERTELVRRICERVFSVKSAGKDWLNETQYTERLAMIVAEPVTIRRYSVDMGIVKRDELGQRYYLA